MNRLAKYLDIILKWRKTIILNTLALTILAVAISFVLPKRYTASAQLLPPSDSDDLLGLSGVLGGGLSSRLSRLRIGAASEWTMSELMVGVLSSRTVMDKVAAECSIARYYRIEPRRTDDIRKQLAELSRFSVGDEGIVSIVVETKTPQLAAKIANAYVAQLDEFLRTSNMSQGRNMRVFLERRVAEVESTVVVAQESLRAFQERNRVVSVDDESKAAIDAYAELKSEAYVRQAALEAVASAASPGNPYAAGLRRELTAFQDQLRKIERGTGAAGFGVGLALSFESLPAVSAEYARRYRDYRIQEETYAMLSQQYEYAKVLEARDAPTLTVLDYASPPQRKSFPKRLTLTVVVFVFALLAGAAYAFVTEHFRRLQAVKPDEYSAWDSVRSELRTAGRDLVGYLTLRKFRSR